LCLCVVELVYVLLFYSRASVLQHCILFATHLRAKSRQPDVTIQRVVLSCTCGGACWNARQWQWMQRKQRSVAFCGAHVLLRVRLSHSWPACSKRRTDSMPLVADAYARQMALLVAPPQHLTACASSRQKGQCLDLE